MNKFKVELELETSLDEIGLIQELQIALEGFGKCAIKVTDLALPEDPDMKTYIIPEWLAKDKNISEKFRATIVRDSGKAYLFLLKNGEELWLPRSQVSEESIAKDQATF
jgi:hypothetical protein